MLTIRRVAHSPSPLLLPPPYGLCLVCRLTASVVTASVQCFAPLRQPDRLNTSSPATSAFPSGDLRQRLAFNPPFRDLMPQCWTEMCHTGVNFFYFYLWFSFYSYSASQTKAPKKWNIKWISPISLLLTMFWELWWEVLRRKKKMCQHLHLSIFRGRQIVPQGALWPPLITCHLLHTLPRIEQEPTARTRHIHHPADICISLSLLESL